MANESAVGSIYRIAWVSSCVLFLFSVSLLLLSHEELAGLSGGYLLWQISICEKMEWTMETCFAALCLLQVALCLSIRDDASRNIRSENIQMHIVGTQSVALSTWLMYAMFYVLAPTSTSFSVKLILLTFLPCTLLAGLRTYSVANDTKMIELVPKLAKKWTPALALFLLGLVIYLSFRSCSLSEWDSYNFAQALERFDLGAHQPHPPGYSLYVFLGKIALAVRGHDLAALSSVSAVSGALCLLPVYAMVNRMHDRQTAVVTCLALMSTRMFWLSSEKAVTHMFGTFLMTLAVCLLYLGLKDRKLLLMSWPVVGIALGARPSYFPLLGLWVYGTMRDKDLKKLPMYLVLFACSVVSWLLPTILLTGWERFWELIRRQYVYVSVNEFVGARYGMQPLERFLLMLGGLISGGFGAPIQLMYAGSLPLSIRDIPSVLILCGLVALTLFVAASQIKRRWNSKKTFLILWTIPYFLVVYAISNPSYPRYFLPIVPPIVIALVSTSWSAAKSMRSFKTKPNFKRGLLFGLVAALILLNFMNSTRLAASIHTTTVPMVQLTQYIKRNYCRDTVVIVFHEYEAFEYHLPGYGYLSAQYHRNQVVRILENLSKKNQTVLITDTSVNHVLGPVIERLGLEKVEVARFEIDPNVETEQHTIILYSLRNHRN